MDAKGELPRPARPWKDSEKAGKQTVRPWPNVRVFDPSNVPAMAGPAATLLAGVEIARRSGQLDRAAVLLAHAKPLARTDIDRSAHAWFDAALERQRGNSVRSDDAFRESARYAVRARDPLGAALALAGLAENERIRGDSASAWRRHAHLLSMFRELNQPRGMSWALGGLGQIALLGGDRAASWRAFDGARQLAVACSDVRAEGWAIRGMGALLITERPRVALRYLEDARARFDDANFHTGRAWVVKAIGDCWLALGCTDRSVAALETAHSMFTAMRDRRGEAFTLLTLSGTRVMERDYAGSAGLLQHSKALFQAQIVATGARACDRLARLVDNGASTLSRTCAATIPGWNRIDLRTTPRA